MLNGISHALGFLAALVATPYLIMRAIEIGNAGFVVGFCTTMILLYFISTIYHLLPYGKAKNILLLLDHSAIFLLIAGTYTPFTLGVVFFVTLSQSICMQVALYKLMLD